MKADELVGYWELRLKMACNCHGYSLGVYGWINRPESVIFDHNYFMPVTADFQKGDIVAFSHKNKIHEIVHTAVMLKPDERPEASIVRHKPGIIATRSEQTTLGQAWNLKDHIYRVYRPSPHILR